MNMYESCMNSLARSILRMKTWKVAIMDSIPWKIVQSLDSRFEILYASALFYMAKTRARTHTQRERERERETILFTYHH